MLNCFSTSRGRSRGTPARQSICERLRNRLTPSRRRRPRCSSLATVTSGKVSPRVSTSDLDEDSQSPNNIGTELTKSPGHGAQCSETPRSSGKVSPEPGTKNQAIQSPGWETEATATGPRDTLRGLVYSHPGLAAAMQSNLTESPDGFRPVWSLQDVRPRSFSKPFPPVLGSQPLYGPFFPGASTTHTSTRSGLMLGRDTVPASVENSIAFEGPHKEDPVVWCQHNEQLRTTDRGDGEGGRYSMAPLLELEEDSRFSELDKDSDRSIHPPPCAPQHLQVPCPAGDESVLPRGAGLWRKLHCHHGHTFQSRHFSRRTRCAVCTDRVGGFGRRLYKCVNCKLTVHKKCHKLVTVGCGQPSLPPEPTTPVDPSAVAADPAQATIQHLSVPGHLEQGDEEQEAGSTRAGGQAYPSPGLQDFDLLSVIGRGSYGKVLLVQLKNSDRLFALKAVKKERINMNRVKRERSVLEQVSNHPFLVGLHYCFQTESRLFFVLDYVSGGDLLFHVQRQRRLLEEHARFYAAEIIIAFNYLHQRGLLYRNLKLENLLLDLEGHIKLTDFCLCKEGLQPGATTRTQCGTHKYVAPEIIAGEDYGFGVDWWALGVVMYEMLVGESPFDLPESSELPDQKPYHHLFQDILEKKIHIPHYLSVEAESVLKSFLNRDPKERLGCDPHRGFADIQEHRFFRHVDWVRMERKQVEPPFKPGMSGEFGLDNFDPEFTSEPAQLTPQDSDIARNTDGCQFAAFEYINPLSVSEEDWV